MAIDKSGKWWKGANFSDLAEYIRLLAADSYPAEKVVQSVCVCGNTTFRLLIDADEGYAQLVCEKCGEATFIGDSDEIWEEAEPKKIRCPCKNAIFEIGVGFSLREDGEISWITVGERCTKCGMLGSAVDWNIDYGPSTHLFSNV